MSKVRHALLVAALGLIGTASAQPVVNLPECRGTMTSTAAQLKCAHAEVDAAGKQLDLVFKALQAKLRLEKGEQAEQALVQSDRTWTAWRDKEVELCGATSGQAADGSLYSLVVAGCKRRLLEERSASLRRYLRDLERDSAPAATAPSPAADEKSPAERRAAAMSALLNPPPRPAQAERRAPPMPLEGVYRERVAAALRANTIFSQQVQGSPRAAFEILLQPKGQILSVALVRSSGMASVDLAIERAIRRTNPFPCPTDADCPPAVLVQHGPYD